MPTPTPTTLPTIRVRRGAQFWEADFSETPQAAQVRELFGTCVLPTPWSITAEGYDVAQALSRNNPGVSIVVERISDAVDTCRSCGAAYLAGRGFDGQCASCRERRPILH